MGDTTTRIIHMIDLNIEHTILQASYRGAATHVVVAKVMEKYAFGLGLSMCATPWRA